MRIAFRQALDQFGFGHALLPFSIELSRDIIQI
jgi:hypothetical protein